MSAIDTMLRLDHHPHPRPSTSSSGSYNLARGAFFVFGFPKNGFGSFDITSRCNLRCRHCYYYSQVSPQDLSDQGWFDLFTQLKSQPRWRFPFLQASWVGGEPLLRKDLVAILRRRFRFNTVVTNGTLPLPYWPDVRFYVSVDGPANVHDVVRGKKGLHARVKRNADRSDLNVTIACCLNRLNAPYVEDMVKEWNQTAVSHMVFDFYTPMIGEENDLVLGTSERDRICDLLIVLRRVYGEFMVVPESTYRLMKSDLAPRVTAHCTFREKGFAYGADGQRKAKCTMGPRADCRRCGCVVPYYMASVTWRRFVISDWWRQMNQKRGSAIQSSTKRI